MINPRSGSNVAGLTECMDLLGYRYLCTNLSLPTLAALVDESKFGVFITDENVESIDFERPCEIVGLTIYHYQRERAYEIADEFHRRGKVVIVGGPYATQNMREGHPKFDVVFCGESELTWPKFLEDYERGEPQSVYTDDGHPDITALPIPRFDLLRHRHYLMGAIQISRGCPYQCDFCTSTVLYGNRMRYKSDAQIVAELNQLYHIGYRTIFILDDNFSGDHERAKEILAVIRDWNDALDEPVMFSTSASIDIAADRDLAVLFAEARITNVFVGLETPNQASLEGAHKYQNLKRDPQGDVEFLHRLGLDVAAGIMVGFDDDNRDTFHRQLEFLQSASIPICFAGMMLAPDGTALKERLIREGRYRSSETVRDHTYDTNVVPKLMTYAELRDGYFWLMNQLYNEEYFLERVRGALMRFPAKVRAAKTHKPKEMRRPLKFLRIIFRLSVFYHTNGPVLRRFVWRYIVLVLRNRRHAATAIYWLIAFVHFRKMLIHHGVYDARPGRADPWITERFSEDANEDVGSCR